MTNHYLDNFISTQTHYENVDMGLSNSQMKPHNASNVDTGLSIVKQFHRQLYDLEVPNTDKLTSHLCHAVHIYHSSYAFMCSPSYM